MAKTNYHKHVKKRISQQDYDQLQEYNNSTNYNDRDRE
jgi:hypothetical protein